MYVEVFERMSRECETIRQDCENFKLEFFGKGMMIETLNEVLREKRTDILKEVALRMLRRRDQALIDSKCELEMLLRRIQDVSDRGGT